jgi:hypothetical protein
LKERKIIAKKLCPIAESILSQPFSLSSSFRRIQAKQLEDKEEEEPKIRIKERGFPLPYHKFTFSGGFLDSVWALLVYCLAFSLPYCVGYYLHLFSFCKFSFSVKVKASKPFRDLGCQYQRPFSGLGCLCVVLS